MTTWVNDAIAALEADAQRSADTHLVRLELPVLPGIDLYLKDESSHPSGSLKHRLARSLFLYGLCNGWIDDGTPIVEASSGSTAISEAFFARLLGLRFVAVIPRQTAGEKIRLIEELGGECRLVEPEDVYDEARRIAADLGGHYMDQFTYAERATDWRGNNNIAESIFEQMQRERHPIPTWIVVSAGTGGTSATIGRWIRYRRLATRLCVADPEHSVFFDHFAGRDVAGAGHPPCPASPPCPPCPPSRIEGIGRSRVEPSFIPTLIDRMARVPDATSLATMRVLESLLHRQVGGSTGTNVWPMLELAAGMHARGETGSLVSLICDAGYRYRNTYYDDAWLAGQGLDLGPATAALERFLAGEPLAETGVHWTDRGVAAT
jgi:cysteine synthase A